VPASITPYSLMHTYVAGLIYQGTHPKAIQTLIGPSSIQTTIDTYGHLFPDANEQASDALQSVFREAAASLPTKKPLRAVRGK
jgi:integrase